MSLRTPRQENMADHGTNGPRNFFGLPERKEEERKKQQEGKKEGEEEKGRKGEGEKKKRKEGENMKVDIKTKPRMKKF